MIGPFPVASTIARLLAQCPALLQVGDAADLATALAQQPNRDVAAFVTLAEVAKPPQLSGPMTLQQIAVTIRVVLFVRTAADADTGAAARLQMDSEVIPQIRRALIGWTPDDAIESIYLQAGRDEGFKAGSLCVQEIFNTSYRLTNQVQP